MLLRTRFSFGWPGLAVAGLITVVPLLNQDLRSIWTVMFLLVASTTIGGLNSSSSFSLNADVKTNAVPLNVPSTRMLLFAKFGFAVTKAASLASLVGLWIRKSILR